MFCISRGSKGLTRDIECFTMMSNETVQILFNCVCERSCNDIDRFSGGGECDAGGSARRGG